MHREPANVNQLISFLSGQRDVGLLIGRIAGGLILLVAGYGKLFGAGFSGIISTFERMGIILPQVTGPFIALLEFFGGAAIILGLLTRYLGVLFTIEFIVVLIFVKMGAQFNNLRIDVALVGFGVLWATQGGGRLALDRILKLER
jgi:putative oxidoreductase